MTSKIRIKMIHYFKVPGNRLLARHILYQTLIYGQFIPITREEQADFVLAIKKGGHTAEVTVGKSLFGTVISSAVKAKIVNESKRRIAIMKRKIKAGKPVNDVEEFTI